MAIEIGSTWLTLLNFIECNNECTNSLLLLNKPKTQKCTYRVLASSLSNFVAKLSIALRFTLCYIEEHVSKNNWFWIIKIKVCLREMKSGFKVVCYKAGFYEKLSLCMYIGLSILFVDNLHRLTIFMCRIASRIRYYPISMPKNQRFAQKNI